MKYLYYFFLSLEITGQRILLRRLRAALLLARLARERAAQWVGGCLVG